MDEEKVQYFHHLKDILFVSHFSEKQNLEISSNPRTFLSTIKIEFYCAKRPCSLCAQIRSRVCLLLACCLFAKVIDFYHEHMEGRHMQWLSGTLKSGSGRFSKSYPPGEH